MEPQLYMHIATRAHFAERHRFYLEQVLKRVLSQFEDLQADA